MSYKFEYVVGNYVQKDLEILRDSFIPNMKENSIKHRTTLDSVIDIKLLRKHTDLEIDIEVLSDSEENQLNNSIHGGLGKALGKGRVKKR
jgi:hypothetical protein